MIKKVINHRGWLKSLLFIPLLVFSQIFGVLVLLLLGYDLTEISSNVMNESVMIIIEYSGLFIVIIMIWLFMKFIDKQPLIEIGFQTQGRLKEINYGILFGLFIMAFAFVFLSTIGEIVFLSYSLDFNQILLSIALFIGVSFFEEIIFRGYMLKNLLESFNPFVALLISSLFFSLIHASNPNVTSLGLCNIFLAGIFLGVSYAFTKNLWFPIALHFSWNFFQAMFGFKVSGLDSYSIIEFMIPYNNMINGGEFGFESSILSIIVLFIGTIIIWNYFKKYGIQKH
ncbi:MAG: CPBP family intramembrane metalloprotease [Flavobacteriaceae bacterium]|nr:CPBP family intramembrane metalloprotease [Flavobacteriaceae bacterium]MBT5012748.1 CPBP family intramembrane metalloprotease [Flavobacteriaceae bacterium]MBT5596967.1 CPBP family intramembrane metalloprotease [Flavobacteriaceae bacterium]MBT5857994.1 CPBP family intramembrane metalloprotease [Flavobacteriaceae bacterium]